MPPPVPDPAGLRRAYTSDGLAEDDLAADPMTQFAAWFADAAAAGVLEPNAMVVSSVGPSGQPSSRTVLLKEFDARGFTFYTNLGSRKGAELAANPLAALLFPWYALERQVVVTGAVEPVDRAEAAAYFASRPRGSQLGAWASRQSSVLRDRAELDGRLAAAAERFPGDVPMPGFWGGLRVRPASVEFWQGGRDRLHDRLRYRRTSSAGFDEPGDWMVERLSP